jgi:hypothetical protein
MRTNLPRPSNDLCRYFSLLPSRSTAALPPESQCYYCSQEEAKTSEAILVQHCWMRQLSKTRRHPGFSLLI